jgi:hypothetical protein
MVIRTTHVGNVATSASSSVVLTGTFVFDVSADTRSVKNNRLDRARRKRMMRACGVRLQGYKNREDSALKKTRICRTLMACV